MGGRDDVMCRGVERMNVRDKAASLIMCRGEHDDVPSDDDPPHRFRHPLVPGREHRTEPGTNGACTLGPGGAARRAMIGSAAAIVAAVAAAAVVAAVALQLLRSQRRSRRQVAELLERLERLESRHRASDESRDESAAPGGERGTPAEAGAPEQETPPSGDVLAGLTSHVRRLVQAPGGEAESLADQAIRCIHRHLEENVAPALIAEELFVSLRTLERGLAMSLDCTPRQLIVAMKMREARRLLQDGGHRVGEVAERLGFADPFHFSRRFKAFYGLSPSELRPTGAARQSGATRSRP
jgi:AraC-like DNA-binding protein